MDCKLTFYSRPTWIEINKTSIVNNIKNIKKFISRRLPFTVNRSPSICPIIKSNAYGHGLLEVGKLIYKLPFVKCLGVTSIEEAILLRENKIWIPILLFGSIFPFENIKEILHYKITPTVASIDVLNELEKQGNKKNKKISFHLKVDTGMNRIGLLPDSIEKFISSYLNCKSVIWDGVYTHFSSADIDKNYTLEQISLFNKICNKIFSSQIKPRIIHSANSAAVLKYPQTYFDMIRPGLMIYGLKPFSEMDKYIKLSAGLSLKSKIVFLKILGKGKFISYAKTYETKRVTKVATVPLGYADGIMRKMSNRGKVIVGEKFCNIIGRVTMDMIMVDVTDVKNVKVGDEVVLIGTQGNKSISVEQVADWCETINYEIVTSLSSRIPRIVV